MMLLRFPTREHMLSYLLTESVKAKTGTPYATLICDYAESGMRLSTLTSTGEECCNGVA